MATDKLASVPAFVAYGNAKLQAAARADFKKNAAKMGYPGKDEIGIVDQTTLDISNTLAAIPETISGYMHDEKRAFALPAPDKKTDQMGWVQHMNSLKAQAEEIVTAELITS